METGESGAGAINLTNSGAGSRPGSAQHNDNEQDVSTHSPHIYILLFEKELFSNILSLFFVGNLCNL